MNQNCIYYANHESKMHKLRKWRKFAGIDKIMQNFARIKCCFRKISDSTAHTF